ILRASTGIVAVSPNILKHYKKYEIKNTVVSNGINLKKFTSKKKPNINDKINLVFVGSNNMQWHGLEKIFELANKQPKWNFNIIGYNQKDFCHINLPNINFLGWMDKNKLEEVYIDSNFGIGSFGNHMVGKEIDSTLKIR